MFNCIRHDEEVNFLFGNNDETGVMVLMMMHIGERASWPWPRKPKSSRPTVTARQRWHLLRASKWVVQLVMQITKLFRKTLLKIIVIDYQRAISWNIAGLRKSVRYTFILSILTHLLFSICHFTSCVCVIARPSLFPLEHLHFFHHITGTGFKRVLIPVE